ncbi:MAG: phosphate ABC transporter permease subunit PstC [Micrococcales bacterium]|nr:phosphate ABC transporter permease subunit PstC [Micrococcales bacterium]
MTSITGQSADPPGSGQGRVGATAASTGRFGDLVFSGAARAAGIIVVVLVALIGVFLLSQALPSLMKNEANFLTSTQWSVSGESPRFGIAGLLWVTVSSSIVAMSIAVPLGVAVALFITQYAPTWLARPAAAMVDLLAAVPSIVYGIWGAYIAGPYFLPIQNGLGDVLGWFPLFSPTNISGASTILFVGVVLAIMVLPIVTALTREVFEQTPTTHKEGALALGATKWEMIRTAVLPFGKPGIISASMLGLGRALGETVAVMIIVSALPEGAGRSWSLLNGGETFASKIANNAGEFDTPQKTGAYIAAGLVLFILTFIVNAIARIAIERRRAFTE